LRQQKDGIVKTIIFINSFKKNSIIICDAASGTFASGAAFLF
jgi:hypothetical protein